MKTKKSIILVVCLLFALMTFFVACDSDKTQNQLVDMYGVVKNPIADPNPYNEFDKTIEGTNYTIDSDFRDNQVVVSLTNAESLNNLYYTYSAQDFEEYGVIDVQEGAQNYLRRFREEYESGVAYTDEGMVHPSKFYRGLLLILDTHSKENVLRVASELRKRKDVSIADPNGILIPFTTIAEEATTSSVNQWGNNKIDLSGAWEYTTGSSSVKVGVMDSGVAKHVALLENLSDMRVVYDYQGMMRSDAQNNDI